MDLRSRRVWKSETEMDVEVELATAEAGVLAATTFRFRKVPERGSNVIFNDFLVKC